MFLYKSNKYITIAMVGACLSLFTHQQLNASKRTGDELDDAPPAKRVNVEVQQDGQPSLSLEEKIEPVILMPYDKSKITTLHAGTYILDSQIYHFGGNYATYVCKKGYCGLWGDTMVNHLGQVLTSRDNTRDIPSIELRPDYQVKYKFDSNGHGKPALFTVNKQEALLRQGRTVTSIMESDPQVTIYLNKHTHHKDFIHVKGDIKKITALPDGIKVNKIIISYLDDWSFWGNIDLNNADWGWLKNLHGLLNPGGQVVLEMRDDKESDQRRYALPKFNRLLLDNAKDAVFQYLFIDKKNRKIRDNATPDLMLTQADHAKHELGLHTALSEEEAHAVIGHVNHWLYMNNFSNRYKVNGKEVFYGEDVSEIVKRKFRDHGFNEVSSQFVPKHTLNPMSLYDMCIIVASRKTESSQLSDSSRVASSNQGN
jgi:hypothetical protein